MQEREDRAAASAVPLRHLLGGYGGILTGDDLHIGEGLQILLALAQGLLVGVDLP